LLNLARLGALVTGATITMGSAPSTSQPAVPAEVHLELSGLQIGETLTEARRAFAAAGRQIIQVTNVTLRGPYEVDNLINERGEIYGNVGVCRGRISSILITISTYDQLMQILRQRLAQHGQPETSFGMIESDDGAAADEQVTFSWPRSHFQIQYPASSAAAERGRGAQILSDESRCDQ
jgi:hypothetical protein